MLKYEQRLPLWNELNAAHHELALAEERYRKALRALEDALIAVEVEHAALASPQP